MLNRKMIEKLTLILLTLSIMLIGCNSREENNVSENGKSDELSIYQKISGDYIASGDGTNKRENFRTIHLCENRECYGNYFHKKWKYIVEDTLIVFSNDKGEKEIAKIEGETFKLKEYVFTRNIISKE